MITVAKKGVFELFVAKVVVVSGCTHLPMKRRRIYIVFSHVRIGGSAASDRACAALKVTADIVEKPGYYSIS